MPTKKRVPAESDKAIKKCHNRCVICGWEEYSNKGKPLVDGAHVKPFENLQKDSHHDIIALCPNHHRLFDKFKIYIDKEGKNAISISEDGKCVAIPLVEDISYVNKPYLAFHKYQFDEVQKKIKKKK